MHIKVTGSLILLLSLTVLTPLISVSSLYTAKSRSTERPEQTITATADTLVPGAGNTQTRLRHSSTPGSLSSKQTLHHTDIISKSVIAAASGIALTFSSEPQPAHPQRLHFQHTLQPLGSAQKAWQRSWEAIPLGSSLHTIEPEQTFTVILDPGHGGSDPGAIGYNGLTEKELTLDIAQRVQLFLNEIGDAHVILTRRDDTGMSRQNRVSAIRRVQADLVISLHFNHLPQTNINLVESFYAGQSNILESLAAAEHPHTDHQQRVNNINAQHPDLSFTDASRTLAKSLQRRLFSEVQLEDSNAYNAGVKQDTLFVLTQSFIPGVLVEISCLSHPAEADRLLGEQYRNRLAAAVVDGIRDYRDSPRPSLHALGHSSNIAMHRLALGV